MLDACVGARLRRGRAAVVPWGATQGADLTTRAPDEPCQPVWTDLDVVFGPSLADTAPPGGDPARLLVLTGRVVGRLRDWCRAADGRWIGLVDFSIYDQNGVRGGCRA